MSSQTTIAHEGIVTNTYDHQVVVEIFDPQSCTGCHMKSFCSAEGEEHRRFIVPNTDCEIGDSVHVAVTQQVALRATLWGYLVPFFIMIVVLIVGSLMHLSEGLLGLLALFALVPYFVGLSLFKKSLMSHFQLKIHKI